jgi:hypothetical protein
VRFATAPRTRLGAGIPATPLPSHMLRQCGVRPDRPALRRADRQATPTRCPARIPASEKLARWEAAEVVLRLHARQRRARRAVPSIVVCKTNASQQPLEFLQL